MNTIACEKHLDISRFAHALSILLSEQTGMDVTVTYRLKGGEHDRRKQHPQRDQAKSPSSQTA